MSGLTASSATAKSETGQGAGTVKAAVIESPGGIENIVYRDWPDPEPGASEVRVKVRACGLNHLGIFVRRGMPGFPAPMPFISGGDVAGVIDRLGEGVTGWRVGERVTMNPQTEAGMIGEELIGGTAGLMVAPAANLVPLPDAMSFETAATIPINYGAANRMLFARGRLAAGETMLVLGASGGVGVACVQYGKTIGATVIAAAGSAGKCDASPNSAPTMWSTTPRTTSRERRGGELHRRRDLGAVPQGGQARRQGAHMRGDRRPRRADRPALPLGARARCAGLQQLHPGRCRKLGHLRR